LTLGNSRRELDFRSEFGVVVAGIEREERLYRERLAQVVLQPADEVIAIGPNQALDDLTELPDFEVITRGPEAIAKLRQHLFVIRVSEDSPLAGSTLGASRLGELMGITIGGLIRDGETRVALSPDEVIQPGDDLLVSEEPERIVHLLELGELQFETEPQAAELESEEVAMVEAALAPRSSLVGKTLKGINFRQRHELQVLAVWREGSPIRTGLANLKLHFGDALLLQGRREKIQLLGDDPDFVVLSASIQPVRRKSKAPFAIAGLMLMIGLVVAGFQPIQVAAFTAASLIVLSGALTMQEAYRAIEWRAIFLVAAILPVGIAMERTGAASWLSETVVSNAGPLGPYAVLAMLVVLSSVLSQGLDGAPTVVLLTPVVIQAAQGLGYSPYPLMMGVALAASAAFMTPFSHKANLLVMGAGGYKAMDYVKVGTPLTVVVLAVIVFLVPVFFPF
jgi:di/tricarboxylate transporter